ncbi:cation/H(+) antiporter 4-like [Mercurialis annua]|uniref:cation/H(+) antiporter 4-like n=1 Tax=Mercurialis annua TaxID=3986 RepID=UPI00215FC686|nr:cation/H(+) antiporter 4-like [Mercurialis annua]
MENLNNSSLNISGECFDYIRVYSEGIWNVKHGDSFLEHSFIRFQIQILAMFLISNTFYHVLFKRLHIPRFSSDFMAGLILGRSGLESLFPEQALLLFPPVPNQVFASLIKVGYVLFTFLTAVRLDTNCINRIGRRGLILGCLIYAFPYAMTTSFDITLNPKIHITLPEAGAQINNVKLYVSEFVRSQFIDISVVLMQLKITNSRLGHLALAMTVIGDVVQFFVGNVMNILSRERITSTRVVADSFFLLILFLGFTIIIMRALSFWFIRLTPEGRPMKDLYVHVFVAIVLVLSSIGDAMGLHYLWGPFVLGLIIPAGSPLATTLTKKLDTMVYGLLIPLMIAFCATKVTLWTFLADIGSAVYFQMAIISYMFKLVATFIFVIALIKISYKEAVALTLILNVKGVNELGYILSFTRLESGSSDSVSGLLLIFLLTSYAPPIIKLLYDPSKHYMGYRKKCIEYTPLDAELRILSCAHKQEDAMAAIRLFELSKPTEVSPISIYGLCLEELVSSIAPLLINHQLGQKSAKLQGPSLSRSHSIFEIYRYFKSQFKLSAQINVFTAVSPVKQMHQDICSLAFDKSCSLIVLPFHQKWLSSGKLISSSIEFRNLNISVLDRAPCSVGILIDCGKNRSLSSIFDSTIVHHIAVIFVGGVDDREALAYSMRMTSNPKLKLTVIYFKAAKGKEPEDWETMLDLESLRKLKQESGLNMNISYMEETVRDGSDTAAIIRSMEGKFELIIAGRRHESNPEVVSGLFEWPEFPELGPIGDFLASSDIVSSVSVLVMQQQILKANHSSVLN